MAIKVKCMNKNCNNYNQELNEGTEICSLCNERAEKFETNVNSKLQMAALILGLAAPIVFHFGFWPWFWAGMGLAPAALLLGIIAKSKPAVIVAIVSAVATAASVVFWFW